MTMDTPQYDVKVKDEASWLGVSVAVGGLLGAVLVASDVDAQVATAAATLATALTRTLGGLLLSKIGGTS
jgi:nitrate/nitrite transporter NarK